VKGVSPHRNIQNPFPSLYGGSLGGGAPSGSVVQNGNQYGR
jgi:hypothetical protein